MNIPVRKIVFFSSGIIIIVSILMSSAIYYLLFTRKGGALITERFVKIVNNEKPIVWQKNEGSLMSGMLYEDIVLEDLKWFPVPNKLKMQTLTIDINSFGLDGITLNVENARLFLPDSEPILFYGKIEKQLLDFNIYSNAISDREIRNLFKADILNKVTGNLSGIDVFVKGTINEPSVNGEFVIENITKNGFSLQQSSCVFEISLKSINNALGLYGPLTFKSGIIKGEKTALIRLQESKIIFNGDPGKSNFDIKAISVVEKIKMNIAFKGSFQEPDLQINSDPPIPKDRLLLSLATNKTWQNTEDVFNKGNLSPDIAKDFIDYFVTNEFAEKFGLKNLSVKYDGEGKGVAVTKDLSDRLEDKYEIEEKKNKESEPDISQKVGGEYKVTETISLEAKKELKQKGTNGQQENKATDDQLLLKFKKSF